MSRYSLAAVSAATAALSGSTHGRLVARAEMSHPFRARHRICVVRDTRLLLASVRTPAAVLASAASGGSGSGNFGRSVNFQ